MHIHNLHFLFRYYQILANAREHSDEVIEEAAVQTKQLLYNQKISETERFIFTFLKMQFRQVNTELTKNQENIIIHCLDTITNR